MGILVIIVLGVVLIYYFFPFYGLSKFKYPAAPSDVQFFDIEKVELAPEVKLFFVTLQAHLERLGFSSVASTPNSIRRR